MVLVLLQEAKQDVVRLCVERERERWRAEGGRANLSEHVLQGEVIQEQFARVDQPLVFGALRGQTSHK